MNLSLDESQAILVSSFADFFSKECPSSIVRESEKDGFSLSLWRHFSEMGAPGMGIPEEKGGLGMGMLELCLVASAAGKVLAPIPFAEVASAGRLVAEFVDDEAWLAGIASGETIVSLVDSESQGVGSGQSGHKQWIAYGAVADHVVTLEGDELIMYSSAESQLMDTELNVGSAAHAFWVLSDSGVNPRTVLARGELAKEAFKRAIAEWKLLTAAALWGLSKEALAIGVEYAKTREQFGTVIGAFQAIALPLADCAMRVDGAELLVYEAAWSDDAEPERFLELCSMALIFASQTAQETSSVSLHTHGGYGFTEEYDIQMYYRRACAWSMMTGGTRNELLRLTSLRAEANCVGEA